MGIFDYFFSHAKQKQDKAIRDKIKNRKFFSKRLIEIAKNKGETERLILEANTNKRLDTVYLHWSLGEQYISENRNKVFYGCEYDGIKTNIFKFFGVFYNGSCY